MRNYSQEVRNKFNMKTCFRLQCITHEVVIRGLQMQIIFRGNEVFTC